MGERGHEAAGDRLAVDRRGGGHVCSGYGAVSYRQAEKIRLLKIEIRPVELFLQAGFFSDFRLYRLGS